MLIVDLLALFDFAALIGLIALAIRTAIMLPRLRVPPPSSAPLIHPSATTPLVSILIPVQNDANVIAVLVRSLLMQTYQPFEIIILDDHSSDGTAAIALASGAGDPRLRVIAGQPLLQGWLAPNWSRHQLAHEANGLVLIFADPRLIWQPDALKAVIDLMQRSQADLLTIWPTVIWGTRGERPTVSLVPRGADRSRANSQFLAFRKSAYQAVSGHVAVRDLPDDGTAFARLIQSKGLTFHVADGAGLIRQRAVRAGVAADLRAAYGGHIPTLVALALTVLIFGLPLLWLVAGWGIMGWPFVPLVLIALGLLLVALTLWIARRIP